MTPLLEIEQPGALTTVQDEGRIGFQRMGVPQSGPLDRLAYRVANALVGETGAAALECLASGPTFIVCAESLRFAFYGARTTILVTADGRTRAVRPGRSVRVARGGRVAIGAFADSGCGYLAFEGGIAAPRVLNSASTYLRGGFGGFAGRAMRRGDCLSGGCAHAAPRAESATDLTPPPAAGAPLRVTRGPQADALTTAAEALFLAASWTVSPDADRMGLRCDGPALAHANGWDVVSDGVYPGAVQAPGSGRPIIMRADHQTVGGYPKIASVIAADLPRLGRLRPGDVITFQTVTRAQAEIARRAQEDALARQIAAFHVPLDEDGAVHFESATLLDANLISGVVDARA